MKRKLGTFLIVLTGLSVITGYVFPESSKLSDDQSKKAKIKVIALNREMMQTRDRDQTLEAFAQDMRIFLQRASDSEFAPTVQQLLGRLEESLASGDLKVAQFYAERGNYAGARSRLKTIIDKYPNFSRIDEVKKLYESPLPQENTK